MPIGKNLLNLCFSAAFYRTPVFQNGQIQGSNPSLSASVINELRTRIPKDTGMRENNPFGNFLNLKLFLPFLPTWWHLL